MKANNTSVNKMRLTFVSLATLFCLGSVSTGVLAQPVTLAASPMTSSAMDLAVGKSTLLKVRDPIARLSVADPKVADALLINPKEIYLVGKSSGETNMTIWSKTGATRVVNLSVIDTVALQKQAAELQRQASVSAAARAFNERVESELRRLLPGNDIHVSTAGSSLILNGTVRDEIALRNALDIGCAFIGGCQQGGAQSRDNINIMVGGASGQSSGGSHSGGQKVINLLQVTDPQQVMLEVKVAEVSKTLLEQLGINFSVSGHLGSFNASFISSFASGTPFFTAARGSNKRLDINAEIQKGLVKILAEPNIMAISGQEASFLAGGKIFIPVYQPGNVTTGSTVALQEEDFGVRLHFTPTVLSGGRINLHVAPEVSELSSTGTVLSTPVSTSSSTQTNAGTSSSNLFQQNSNNNGTNLVTVLPTILTRQEATTIQLNDGQTFAIGGLIRNNVTESVSALPVLGELPILGSLFRSSQFSHDKTELLFIVTPHLVKPLPSNYLLPTDTAILPTRSEFFMNGKMEATPKQSVVVKIPQTSTVVAPQPLPAPAPTVLPPQPVPLSESSKRGGFILK